MPPSKYTNEWNIKNLSEAQSRRFVMPLAHAHLGDVLCTSSVPRKLSQVGITPYVTANPMTLAVFKNNPHIVGFRPGRRIGVRWKAMGRGHIIERVLRWYGLPPDVLPCPEIYLDKEELAWAAAERRKWPQHLPVCILSCGATTDRRRVATVDWPRVAEILATRFTVIQPALDEPHLPGCIVYEKLPIRRYMSLFSVANVFCGGTSGGSHVAAAFRLPALIVTWESLMARLRFPARRYAFKNAFLYPQHSFIAAERLTRSTFDSAHFREAVAIALDPRRRTNAAIEPSRLTGLRASPHDSNVVVTILPSRRFARIPKINGAASSPRATAAHRNGFAKPRAKTH